MFYILIFSKLQERPSQFCSIKGMQIYLSGIQSRYSNIIELRNRTKKLTKTKPSFVQQAIHKFAKYFTRNFNIRKKIKKKKKETQKSAVPFPASFDMSSLELALFPKPCGPRRSDRICAGLSGWTWSTYWNVACVQQHETVCRRGKVGLSEYSRFQGWVASPRGVVAGQPRSPRNDSCPPSLFRDLWWSSTLRITSIFLPTGPLYRSLE